MGPPKNPFFESWACPDCLSGKLRWIASELGKDRLLVTHKFACDHCANAEAFVVPYVEASAKGTKNAA